MKIASLKIPGFAAMAAICLCLVPAAAQTKPPESASKIKKVLLYNKIGGWVDVTGVQEIKDTFSRFAAAKGFELVQSADDADMTLDYLKQFQVIVWNNNSNGGSSLPNAIARQAVLDYLDQGGGWMLINRAGDHSDSWSGLSRTMGTNFYLHGKVGPAEVVIDSAARSHRELKWMVEGFPEAFGLNDRWFSFRNTVRPLPGVTVVATARAVSGETGIIIPFADASGDHTYIWAREVGQGRFFYNAIGAMNNTMSQQDSIVPRLYWENLRYAAGDYQNGCTTPGKPGFDPSARVHDEVRCSGVGLRSVPARFGLVISKGALRMKMASPEGPIRARLRDLRGTLVWERTLPIGTREMALDDAIKPGVYLIELRSDAGAFQARLLLP